MKQTAMCPENPLVSVMVPAYNAESTIRLCLDSIYAQDYRPIELIVINDGSEDNTGTLVEEWISKHEGNDFSCKYVSHDNRGLMAGRNEGVALSSGEYLQFLDADDCLHHRKMSTCINNFKKGDYDVVVPYTEKFVLEDTKRIEARLSEDPKTLVPDKRKKTDTRIANVNWHSSGPVFSRAIVEKSGKFPEDLNPAAEEMEFHGRIKSTTKKIAFIPTVLSFYRVGAGSALTTGTETVYRARIDGADSVRDILVAREISDSSEWSCLFWFCIVTLRRIATQTQDTSLFRDAHECLARCSKDSGSACYRFFSGFPPGFCWLILGLGRF